MLKPDQKKIKAFASPKDLSQWLKVNHATENELWIKVFKKGSGTPSVDWNQIVEEVLCWGWIDGIKKSLNEQAYLQRITPRKARSGWSKKNTEHVERLMREGKMKELGIEQVRVAKADGRWGNAYPPVSETKVPADFLEALQSEPKAKQFFDTLNKSSQFAIMSGLMTAKRPETRQRRLEKFMGMLIREEKPDLSPKKKNIS